MPIGERAKQFAPFSPLHGLEEALAEREKRREERRYPDEDTLSSINAVLNELKSGDSVSVFSYNETECCYDQTDGDVRIIDELHGRLFVGGKEILFGDILDIALKKSKGEI